MEVVEVYDDRGYFRIKGICPYCKSTTTFPTPAKPYEEKDRNGNTIRLIGACRCDACFEFILAILEGNHFDGYLCIKHHPVGNPNDSVSEEVPSEVSEDFKEALRCICVKSFKATVLMCRRALQVSCDREGAEGKDLYTQIADLASKQRITQPLKDMAHRIRLLGKKGAHGDFSDVDDTITKKDAEDAIKFMAHYLDHVYVLPKRLEDSL